MYKIIYLGNKVIENKQEIVNHISLSDEHDIHFITETTIDDVIAHFFVDDPVILLIIEETIEGFEDFIREIKEDEIFELLPVFLVLAHNTVKARKKYYNLEIDGYLRSKFKQDDLVHICNSAVRYRIKLNIVLTQLREVTERNIERAIQLDLIKKFIPLTVWNRTEKLAEHQKIIIPEEESELAILFADLQSFTTITESMTPKDVISMLNSIFDIATQIIYQNNGDIDKFIGDAFLAIFKTPEEAVFSSILIQEELNRHRTVIEDSSREIKMRIGLHYGRVIRGSVGGTMRYDHTIVGDPINTAQRLESAAEPGGILASKQILDRIDILKKYELPYTQLDLKGKSVIIEACHLFEFYKQHEEIKSQFLSHMLKGSLA